MFKGWTGDWKEGDRAKAQLSLHQKGKDKSELQRYTVLSMGLPVKEKDKAAGTKKYIYVSILMVEV